MEMYLSTAEKENAIGILYTLWLCWTIIRYGTNGPLEKFLVGFAFGIPIAIGFLTYQMTKLMLYVDKLEVKDVR